MKTLIVFYSRTGNTKKLAMVLAEKLGAELEELEDNVNRKGLWGWIRSGKDGLTEKTVELKELKKKPGDYDLVILGTPIWAGGITPAVRTYLVQNADKIKEAAFFCTMANDDPGKAFLQMETILGKKPRGRLAIKGKDLLGRDFLVKTVDFIKELEG